MCSVIRLIAPPLPAASRPSNTTTRRMPVDAPHSSIFTSSTWSRSSSFSYSFFGYLSGRSPSSLLTTRRYRSQRRSVTTLYGPRSAGTSSLGRRIRRESRSIAMAPSQYVRLIVDEHGAFRRHAAELLERRPIDRGIRLHRADLERQHDPVEHLLEPEPFHDGPGRERAVADERGLHAAIAERREGREHVVVEVDAALEVRALELDQLVDERGVVRNARPPPGRRPCRPPRSRTRPRRAPDASARTPSGAGRPPSRRRSGRRWRRACGTTRSTRWCRTGPAGRRRIARARS